jgi:hypothetical protein
MLEKGMLSKNVEVRSRNCKEVGENCTLRIFMICTAHKIVTRITSRSIRWAGYVARMGEKICIQGFNRKT